MVQRSIHNQDDFERLPIWARMEIQALKRDLEDAQARLRMGPRDSNTFLEPYPEKTMTPLGRDVIVRFGGSDFHNTFTVRYDTQYKRLKVQASRGVFIRPTASNCFEAIIDGS